MNVNCAHQIEIENLNEQEIIKHTILLIKGRINGQTHALDSAENNIKVCVQNKEGKSHRLNTEAQVARSGEFKFILDLQSFKEAATLQQKLTLSLQYCNVSKINFNISLQTQETVYKLQALLILCSDEAQEEQQQTAQQNILKQLQIIDFNLRLLQSVYADKLRAAVGGRCTFALKGACQIFRTQLTRAEAWQLSEDELWQFFAKEILNSEIYGNELTLKFVGFIACSKYEGAAVAATADYSYANIRRHLKAHAALGGGGLALFGTAYFYCWPRDCQELQSCLRNDTKVDLDLLPDDSNYRRNYAGVYATTLGAVCHELGHIFDLGHTSDGVMGTGFDYINRVFTADSLTENLPTRIIQKGVLEAAQQQPIYVPKFTSLRRQPNSFLQKYHEQRESDGFYFTRSCALILAHHKWFQAASALKADVGVDASLNDKSGVLSLVGDELLLVEIRRNDNSLVTQFYEFVQQEPPIFHFQLPANAAQQVLEQRSHYVFVLSRNGFTKRL